MHEKSFGKVKTEFLIISEKYKITKIYLESQISNLKFYLLKLTSEYVILSGRCNVPNNKDRTLDNKEQIMNKLDFQIYVEKYKITLESRILNLKLYLLKLLSEYVILHILEIEDAMCPTTKIKPLTIKNVL